MPPQIPEPDYLELMMAAARALVRRLNESSKARRDSIAAQLGDAPARRMDRQRDLDETGRLLAEQIRLLRSKRGLSQEELAFRAGLHRTTSVWLNERRSHRL